MATLDRARPLAYASLLAIAAATPAAAQSNAAIQRQLEQLRQVIEQQQKTIDSLTRQVQTMERNQTETRQQVETAQTKADQAVAATKEGGLVAGGNPNIRLTLSGQINRMVNYADDGDKGKFYFLDNNNSVSRLMVKADARLTDDITSSAVLELAFAPNRSDRVSQRDEALSAESNGNEMRKVEAVFSSSDYGILFLGRGDPSTKDIARQDLSGTDMVSYAAVQDQAGGLFFTDQDNDDRRTTTTVANVFTDLDSSRQNRIRYDTPKLAGGYLTVTGAEDQKWGAALRWSGEVEGFQGVAGVGLSDPSTDDVDTDLAGSASIIHKATGLNLTGGMGRRFSDDSDPVFFYVKPGIRANIVPIGRTSFALDYQRTVNRPTSSSEGDSVGGFVVQNLQKYGIDLYTGLRWYRLDDDTNRDLNDVWVATAGTRIKF